MHPNNYIEVDVKQLNCYRPFSQLECPIDQFELVILILTLFYILAIQFFHLIITLD